MIRNCERLLVPFTVTKPVTVASKVGVGVVVSLDPGSEESGPEFSLARLVNWFWKTIIRFLGPGCSKAKIHGACWNLQLAS